jgi:hypothetical protein
MSHLEFKGFAGVGMFKVLWQQVPGQVLLAAVRHVQYHQAVASLLLHEPACCLQSFV